MPPSRETLIFLFLINDEARYFHKLIRLVLNLFNALIHSN